MRPVACEKCGERVIRNEMHIHDEKCNGAKVACTFGCGRQLRRGQLPAHLKSVCPKRPARCNWCGEDMSVQVPSKRKKCFNF